MRLKRLGTRKRGTRELGKTSIQCAGNALSALFTNVPTGILQRNLAAVDRMLKQPSATILFRIARLYVKTIKWLLAGSEGGVDEAAGCSRCSAAHTVAAHAGTRGLEHPPAQRAHLRCPPSGQPNRDHLVPCSATIQPEQGIPERLFRSMAWTGYIVSNERNPNLILDCG